MLSSKTRLPGPPNRTVESSSPEKVTSVLLHRPTCITAPLRCPNVSWRSFSPSHSTACSTRLTRIPFQRYFQQVSRANNVPIRPTSPQGPTLPSVWDACPIRGYLRFRRVLYRSRKLWVLPPSRLRSSPVQRQH